MRTFLTLLVLFSFATTPVFAQDASSADELELDEGFSGLFDDVDDDIEGFLEEESPAPPQDAESAPEDDSASRSAEEATEEDDSDDEFYAPLPDDVDQIEAWIVDWDGNEP